MDSPAALKAARWTTALNERRQAERSARGSIMEPWMKAASGKRFCLRPLEKLSKTVTLWPRSRNCRTTWLPM
jgi:hypothetical protein